MKDVIGKLIEQAIEQMKTAGKLPADIAPRIQVTHTKEKSHGDLATNVAMMMAKGAGKPPREVAQLLVDELANTPEIERAEIAGPGFINFFLAQDAQTQIIDSILKQGADFGRNNDGQGQKVQVEFVSANPTGPLHVGHGRGAAVGDCICRLLENSGWDVTREFYYNDAGQQINNLALSVQARCKGFGPADTDNWPADGYQGEYIKDVANDYMAGKSVVAEDKQVTGAADADNLEAIKEFAVAYLRREQDLDLKAFEVNFDVFFLESSLYEEGKVEEAVQRMIDNGYTYEKDGALWLKTTEFGDDKDRVMRKTDGGYTYFVPDVAYHLNKWQRGFKKVINEQGSDHHSTITRVRAGIQALNLDVPKGFPDYVLHQMVTVMRDGEEVKISKRAGGYVTLRDLIDEVGCDATRYFLAARRAESQLTFDINLATSQKSENPVYYIQYAHARVCSAFNKLAEKAQTHDAENGKKHHHLLTMDHETQLMERMSQYPDLVASAARNHEPHLVAHYLRDLANDLHSYNHLGKEDPTKRWIVEGNKDLTDARLNLISSTRQVIANGLNLLGVSAPESM
ncbi:arginine--tRNA ligase [Pleionea sp. CnH1-48]|uniref:arginine--tRNA ligase n=1 Tax=Pleionea sp. CnH1-48 TaxID=2954494 RepID=UPI002097DC4B|nr:arginine--tRNA ligase [Pleionea sp. CnH1-48]MCO7224485.1 arginine--tRNA ligase [Pleionea sp. CnH1-48]